MRKFEPVKKELRKYTIILLKNGEFRFIFPLPMCK